MTTKQRGVWCWNRTHSRIQEGPKQCLKGPREAPTGNFISSLQIFCLKKLHPRWYYYPLRISETASIWCCNWNFWILFRMFWLSHSSETILFEIKCCLDFSMFCHTIYSSFPMSCKDILWSLICCFIFVYRLKCWKAKSGWISGSIYSKSTCGADMWVQENRIGSFDFD